MFFILSLLLIVWQGHSCIQFLGSHGHPTTVPTCQVLLTTFPFPLPLCPPPTFFLVAHWVQLVFSPGIPTDHGVVSFGSSVEITAAVDSWTQRPCRESRSTSGSCSPFGPLSPSPPPVLGNVGSASWYIDRVRKLGFTTLKMPIFSPCFNVHVRPVP